DIGVREVDDDLGTGDVLQPAAEVDGRDELQVLRGLHRPHHLRPDPPSRAEHPDMDGHAITSCRSSGRSSAWAYGPTTAAAVTPPGRRSRVRASARTSSPVTASMRATVSSTPR